MRVIKDKPFVKEKQKDRKKEEVIRFKKTNKQIFVFQNIVCA